MLKLKKISIAQFFLFGSLFFLLPACGKDDDGGAPGGGGPVDVPVSVTIQDLSIDEGSTLKPVFVRVQLNTPSDQRNTIFLSTKDVTATAGEDFNGFSDIQLVFEPGDLIKDHRVELTGDEDFEGDETFEVVIDKVEGDATIQDGTAVITIVNDDEGTFEVDIPTTGFTSPTTYPNMTLLWEDDFCDSEVDLNNWTFEFGNGNSGWGNNELQNYKSENASIVNCNLVIEAKKELNGQYTSTRMITKNKFDFQFGRVDIRAALPTGQGIWPALWMLGSNIDAVGWPGCGEIDIMEIVGHDPNRLHGTAHWKDGGGSHASFGKDILSSSSLKNEFHVYSVIWSDGQIRWLLDDVQYNVLNTSGADLSEFNAGDFFFIFNVAVGGNWPGSPDATTQFPQHMIVDYIRVFQ